MYYNIIFGLAGVSLVLMWLIMLKKHKFQNVFQLLGIGIAALVSISKVLVPESELKGGLSIGAILFALGFLFEEFKIIKRDYLFVRNSKIKVYKFEEMNQSPVGEISEELGVVKVEKTYQNTNSMNFKTTFNSLNKTEPYVVDYDIYLTVIKGEIKLHFVNKTVIVHTGEIYKIPAYTQRSVQCLVKGTEVGAVATKNRII